MPEKTITLRDRVLAAISDDKINPEWASDVTDVVIEEFKRELLSALRLTGRDRDRDLVAEVERLRRALAEAVSLVGVSRIGHSPSPTHQVQVSVATVERWRAALNEERP